MVDLSTLVFFLRTKGDYRLTKYCRQELAVRYGQKAADVVEQMACAKNEEDLNTLSDSLHGCIPSDPKKEAGMVSQIRNGRDLTRLPITTIMEMYRSGDAFLVQKSKDFVEANYGGFVHSIIVNEFSKAADEHGEDLYQSGVIGLMCALRRYDESRGKFLTWAARYIRHEIIKQIGILQEENVMVGATTRRKINQAKRQLEAEGLEPTAKRISSMTKIREETVRKQLEYEKQPGKLSLDQWENDPEAYDLEKCGKSPEDIYIQKEICSCLVKAIKDLPDEERQVLELRFLEGLTNEKIASKMHCSVSHVKKVFKRCFELMRMDVDLLALFPEYLNEEQKERVRLSRPAGRGPDLDDFLAPFYTYPEPYDVDAEVFDFEYFEKNGSDDHFW